MTAKSSQVRMPKADWRLANRKWRFALLILISAFSFQLSDFANAQAVRVFDKFSKLLDVNITSPTNGQVPQFNATSGKWENADPPSQPFISSNTARVDPSGNDTTGTIGDLNKPFLTVQAAVDAVVALGTNHNIIDIGNNEFTEDIVVSAAVGVRLEFVGASGQSQALVFNSFTYSGGVSLHLNFTDCTVGAIVSNGGVFVDPVNCFLSSILTTNGYVTCAADFGSSQIGNVTATGQIILYGMSQVGTVSSPGSEIDIFNCRPVGADGGSGLYSALPTIDSDGSAVFATGSLLQAVTDAGVLTLKDSRVIGTNNATSTVYADVLLSRYASANTARIDPSGDDTTGTIGDLDKPFLTIQAACDQAEAIGGEFYQLFVEVGVGASGNHVEAITTGLATISFINGIGGNNSLFSSLTLTSSSGVSLQFVDTFVGNITATNASDVNIIAYSSEFGNITSEFSGATLHVQSDGGHITTGDLTSAGPITAYGLNYVGTVSAPGQNIKIRGVTPIFADADGVPQGLTINSAGSEVWVTGAPIHQVTACGTLHLIDSRVVGTNNASSTVYADVLLAPRVVPQVIDLTANEGVLVHITSGTTLVTVTGAATNAIWDLPPAVDYDKNTGIDFVLDTMPVSLDLRANDSLDYFGLSVIAPSFTYETLINLQTNIGTKRVFKIVSNGVDRWVPDSGMIPSYSSTGGFVGGQGSFAINSGAAAIANGEARGFGSFATQAGHSFGDNSVALQVGYASGRYSRAFGPGAATFPFVSAIFTSGVSGEATDWSWNFDPVGLTALYKVGDIVYLWPNTIGFPAPFLSPDTGFQEKTITALTATSMEVDPTDLPDGEYVITPFRIGDTNQTSEAGYPFNVAGDNQVSQWQLSILTTNATPTGLTTDKVSATTRNQPRILVGQVRAFTIDCVGLKDDGTTLHVIKKGFVRNSDGTCSISDVTEERWANSGASAWDVTVAADDTNDLLAVTVTGAASSNIRWLAHVTSTEVAWFPPSATFTNNASAVYSNSFSTAGVTSVTGTAPIASSGGATPAISISAATTGAAGSMSGADKTKLDAISGTNTGDQTITLTGNVTGSGTGSFAATIANDAVTYAKMQNVSATDKVLGRSTAGSGDVEEIAMTAAGRALIDDAAASDQRTTLGLGTLATQSGTFSGTSSGTNTGDQTNISGNAATVTTNANLTGDVTSVGNATTFANGVVFVKSVASVSLTATGLTDIFTVPAGKTFTPASSSSVQIVVTSTTGNSFTTAGQGRVQDSDGNLWMNATAFNSALSAAGKAQIFAMNLTQVPLVAGKTLRWNTTTGNSSTTLVVTVFVTGFYY